MDSLALIVAELHGGPGMGWEAPVPGPGMVWPRAAAKQVGLLRTMTEKISGLQDPACASRGQKQPTGKLAGALATTPEESEHMAITTSFRWTGRSNRRSRRRTFRLST